MYGSESTKPPSSDRPLISTRRMSCQATWGTLLCGGNRKPAGDFLDAFEALLAVLLTSLAHVSLSSQHHTPGTPGTRQGDQAKHRQQRVLAMVQTEPPPLTGSGLSLTLPALDLAAPSSSTPPIAPASIGMATGVSKLPRTMSQAIANGACHVEERHQQNMREGQVQQFNADVAAAAVFAAAREQHQQHQQQQEAYNHQTLPTQAYDKQQHKNQQELERQQRKQDQEEEEKAEEMEYGRGKRKIKHLTVTINGDQVKLANNYTVTGAHYVYDKSKTGAYYRPTVREPEQKKKPATDAAPRVMNPILRALQERNHQVAAQKAITDARRDTFLRGHLSGLRPFISDKVAARLASVALEPTVLGATVAAAAAGGGGGKMGNRSTKKKDGPPKLSKQPSCIVGTELRDYQLRGLNFLLDRHHHGVPMILGDEMGLGKTLQSLSFLAYLRFERGIIGPALVVCPLSVLSSWMNEAKKWCPQLRVVQLHTSDITERKRQCKEILPRGDYDVCVTTYDMVKNPVARHALLRQIRWSTLVLDEGHIVKAETTEIAQTVRKIHFGNVLLLTGTPLQVNPPALRTYPRLFSPPPACYWR